MVQNKGVIFRQVPVGFPVPGQDLVVEPRDFDIKQAPPLGGVITKNLYTSFDPYQRSRMRESADGNKSYTLAFKLGQPIKNNTLAKIIESDNERFQVGDLVAGPIPTEQYSRLPKEITQAIRKIGNPYGLDLRHFLGALGMPGLTAYSSYYEIGKPVKGDTIFISAASGAVGQIVGQLAKLDGLRVIGSVGSDEKLEFILKELGFDGGFNYKTEKPLEALRRLAPKGIDIYFENVGGVQLEAALEMMNNFGRIIACGMISQYNNTSSEHFGVRNLHCVITKRITMRGFIVDDKNIGPLYYEEWSKNVAKWLSEGKLKTSLSVTEGIDNAPEGFVGMLQGKNLGKAILKIADFEED